MAIVVRVLNFEDGFYSVRIKPEVGHAYVREFSKAALEEYIEDTKRYCEWKSYEFIYKDETEAKERLYSKKENGKEEDDFILVESHYFEAKDGCGKHDAISFTVGKFVGTEQPEKVHPFEYDNMITVSTKEARSFAQAILILCETIEK